MALAEPVETTKELVTAEVLWQMGASGERFELVKGELIEMTPPGGLHGSTAVELGSLLRDFVKPRNLGGIMVESGYLLTTNPDTVRGPDVSFLSTEKISPDGIPDGYISGAPDLAVEIVSPSDTASIIQDKVQDYLTYGTQLVWVIYPRQRIVVVHYPDGTARTLNQTDTLSGEDILPDFSCRVVDIFS
jgi:Uma2 family endonuclease